MSRNTKARVLNGEQQLDSDSSSDIDRWIEDEDGDFIRDNGTYLSEDEADTYLNSVLQATLTNVIKEAGGEWDDATRWYLSEHGADIDMEDNEALQVVLDHVSQEDWDPDFGKVVEPSLASQVNEGAGFHGIKLGVTPYVNTRYPKANKSPMGNNFDPSLVQQDDFGGKKPINSPRGVKGVVKARQSPKANNMGRIRNASTQQTSKKQMRIR